MRRERRLIEAEIQDCRRHSLYFHCDEKYIFRHRCNKEFNIMLVNEDETEDEDEDTRGLEEKGGLVQLSAKVQISLNSLVGLSTPGTMKVKGTLKGEEVIVLVDCGASHNFISRELVHRLRIPITDTTRFGVETGIGDSIQGRGVCKDVVLVLQELTIVESFLPIDLGTTDVVLGMQWLGSVGRIEVDWNRLEMRIKMGMTMVTLRGDPSLHRSRVSLRSMFKTLKKGCPGVLIEFLGITVEESKMATEVTTCLKIN